jgi:FkbM family methyltransferase
MFNLLKMYLKIFIKKAINHKLRKYIYTLLNKSTFDEADFIYDFIMKSNNCIEPIMIDVGAHHGGSSEPFARAGWAVYAFEPDPKNREYFELFYNGYSKVKIDKRAVTDKDGELMALYTSNLSSGITTLSPFHPSHFKTIEVETITLTKVCREINIKKIGFLKIDTEGFDLFVLKGIPWKNILPQIILCEYENNKTNKVGYDTQDLVQYLESYNYNLIISEWFPIKSYGTKHKWKGFVFSEFDKIDPNGWGNIIALRDEDTYELISRYFKNNLKNFS